MGKHTAPFLFEAHDRRKLCLKGRDSAMPHNPSTKPALSC